MEKNLTARLERLRKPVSLSLYCTLITVVTVILCCAVIISLYHKDGMSTRVVTLMACVMAMTVAALIYSPLAISADGYGIKVHRPLAVKRIPYDFIYSVEPVQPTMGDRRLIASGGLMGYWGWFRGADIGRYFAYYGKGSQCFMVRLKDGSQYMLGCMDTPDMIEFIRARL